MRKFKLVVPAFVLMAGMMVPATLSFAKKEYTTKEKTGCVTCHVKAGAKELNKVGDCYKDSKDLKACQAKK